MRTKVWIAAIFIGTIGAGLGVWQLAAQMSEDEYGLSAPTGDVPTAPPGSTAVVIDGHRPPPDAERTATPDVRNAKTPEKAWDELSAVPSVSPILQAIRSVDVDALLELMDWQPQPCGSPHGSTEGCPDGVEIGTDLPMINTGDAIPYWLTEGTVREQLKEVLSDGDLHLYFAARAGSSPYLAEREPVGDICLLGVEGSPRPVSSWGSLTALTGLFFNADSGREHPVVSLSPLTPDWSATEQAALANEGYEGLDIIVFRER